LAGGGVRSGGEGDISPAGRAGGGGERAAVASVAARARAARGGGRGEWAAVATPAVSPPPHRGLEVD